MGADAGNSSGTPPGDASKIVRTTIHRVSAGVLKIKLHLVFAPGEWTSICGNTSWCSFHDMIC